MSQKINANESVGCLKKKSDLYQFLLSGSFISTLFNTAQAPTLIRYELMNDDLKQVCALHHKIKIFPLPSSTKDKETHQFFLMPQ